MKLIKRGRFYHAHFKTAHGRTSVPTKATTLADAQAAVKTAGLAELEMAGRSGSISRQAIGRIITGKKLTITKALEHYARWMSAVGKAEKTIDNNVTTVACFARETHTDSLPPSAIDEEIVDQWINGESEAKASTRNIKLAALRSFFGFCVAKGFASGDPAHLTKVKRDLLTHQQKEKDIREPFDRLEVTRLKAHLEKTDAIFWLFAVTLSNEIGLRLGDICQLEWDCFNIPKHIIVHTDKTDKRISVPISEELNELLTRIPVQSPLYLFPEQRAIINSIQRRSLLSVQFKRLLAGLYITGKSFHCLRHTCITRWAKQGRSLESIGQDVGHSNTETTKGYVKK